MDTPSEEQADIDVERVGKPEADAFRYLANALGATFAGDSETDPTEAANAPTTPGEITRLPQKGSSHATTTADPKRGRLLDRVPIPLVVTDGDSVAFINRTALGVLGYGSAAILDAAGGVGALFGTQSGRDGYVNVRTAAGQSFAARVEMSPIEWGFQKALLLSIVPFDAPQQQPEPVATETVTLGDPLTALINAIPSPIAIVTRTGEVEAGNTAFVALGPDDRPVLRLDERLNPLDMRHLMEMVSLSFTRPDAIAETAWPLMACGVPYWVSAGALAGGPHALVSFQRYSAAHNDVEPEGARFVALAEAAAGEVRRLIGEASVLLIHRRARPAATLTDADMSGVQCIRTVLLAAAARAKVGSVLTLESSATDITLHLKSTHTADPLHGAISDHVHAMAADTGLQLNVEANQVTIASAEAEQTLRSA